MAGKHGFSGPRPPPRAATPVIVRQSLRLPPPANDNVRLGRLRFTGVRLTALAVGLSILLLAGWLLGRL